MADDQSEAIGFLSDPSSYGGQVDRIKRLETHISLVFLAGDRAYKLKRAVKLPYLDFSTLERRRRFCDAELTLNRRTAPELYLEMRAIVRRSDGSLGWGNDGDIVDYVVVMRRFEQDQRLDVIAHAGGLNPSLLYAIAAHIAEFHATAVRQPGFGGAASMAAIARENDECLRSSRDVSFASERIEELRERTGAWLTRLAALLDSRRAAGKVRRCHGDLHLRNICVLDGKPALFDCIEFSEAFANIDVLYDLAFLLMDLIHQGRAASANLILNRYLDLTEDHDGLAAMPLFLSMRAAIRAHVAASTGGDAIASAHAYLDQAVVTLHTVAPRLVAIGGLSGTGKSTLAAAVASELGAPPGARVLRSDVIRKRLCELEPEARLPEQEYSAETTDRVYQALCGHAAAALQAGYCAIIDAVALRPDERQSFAAVARDAGVPFTGIWLEAPPASLTTRVAARQNDASDATAAVVERQLEIDPGRIDWHRVDAAKDQPEVVALVRQALRLH